MASPIQLPSKSDVEELLHICAILPQQKVKKTFSPIFQQKNFYCKIYYTALSWSSKLIVTAKLITLTRKTIILW